MIEDNPEHIELSREYLPSDEFEVVTALSCSEGLDKIKRENFDLVILDYFLPDCDGLSFLKRIRDAGINTRVIIVTAQDSPEISFEARKLGACDYFVKTFRYYKDLRERILESLSEAG